MCWERGREIEVRRVRDKIFSKILRRISNKGNLVFIEFFIRFLGGVSD